MIARQALAGFEDLRLVIRFFLELFALAAVAVWGFHIASGSGSQIAVAVAAPVLFAAVWAVVASPKAVLFTPPFIKWLLGLALLELAAGALWWSGFESLAVGFAVVAAINAGLLLWPKPVPGA